MAYAGPGHRRPSVAFSAVFLLLGLLLLVAFSVGAWEAWSVAVQDGPGEPVSTSGRDGGRGEAPALAAAVLVTLVALLCAVVVVLALVSLTRHARRLREARHD